MLEKLVFNKDSADPARKYELIEEIFARLIALENVPVYLTDKIELKCKNMVADELKLPIEMI